MILYDYKEHAKAIAALDARNEKAERYAADIAKHKAAMNGERPCPICGAMEHPKLKCGDGRMVEYCSPKVSPAIPNCGPCSLFRGKLYG
jgi:hypothetical protein